MDSNIKNIEVSTELDEYYEMMKIEKGNPLKIAILALCCLIPFSSYCSEPSFESKDEPSRKRARFEETSSSSSSSGSSEIVNTYSDWTNLLPSRVTKWGIPGWEHHDNPENPEAGYSYKLYSFPQHDLPLANRAFKCSVQLKSEEPYRHFIKSSKDPWEDLISQHISYQLVDVYLKDDNDEVVEIRTDVRVGRPIKHKKTLQYIPKNNIQLMNAGLVEIFETQTAYFLPRNGQIYYDPTESLADTPPVNLTVSHVKFEHNEEFSYQLVALSCRLGNGEITLFTPQNPYKITQRPYKHEIETSWAYEDSSHTTWKTEEKYFDFPGGFGYHKGGREYFSDATKRSIPYTLHATHIVDGPAKVYGWGAIKLPTTYKQQEYQRGDGTLYKELPQPYKP